MSEYSPEKEWNKVFAGGKIAYPPEPLIRILLGTFPDLDFFDKDFAGKSVVDLGYGDGRNFPLYDRLNLKISGMEITNEIVAQTHANPIFDGLNLDLKTGRMSAIPFEAPFDYVVSWNSCYYMDSAQSDFADHASEMLRLCKPGGSLIVSVPQKTSFIYKNAKALGNGNIEVRDDYFGVRNGQPMRMFQDANDFYGHFKPSCSRFASANLNSQWFGLDYHWDVFVMQKA